jgi:hypothetical protein
LFYKHLINFILIILVPNIGLLFEYWFIIYEPISFSRSFKNSLLTEVQYIEKFGHKFFMWFLYSCKLISQKELIEYKNISFLLSVRGLTRSSIDTISPSKIISSKSTMYRYQKEALSYSFKPSNYIIWVDNYSKFYKKSTINHLSPGYNTYNWTAIGCIAIDNNILSNSHFTYDNLNKYYNLIKNLLDLTKFGINDFHHYSICKAFDIYSIPIRNPDRLNIKSYYNLDDFYPQEILPYNIGSDDGFKSILDHLSQNYTLSNNSIIPIIVDINIYWRFYKWTYNPRNISNTLSNTFIPILGFWHNYKEILQLIWKNSIQYLIAPLCHTLWPDSPILIKPKVGHAEIFFTYLTLAYTNDLDDYIILCLKKSNNKNIKIILKNIRFILRSAIPFVYIILINLINCLLNN